MSCWGAVIPHVTSKYVCRGSMRCMPEIALLRLHGGARRGPVLLGGRVCERYREGRAFLSGTSIVWVCGAAPAGLARLERGVRGRVRVVRHHGTGAPRPLGSHCRAPEPRCHGVWRAPVPCSRHPPVCCSLRSPQSSPIGCCGTRCHDFGPLVPHKWRVYCPCGACNRVLHRVNHIRGRICNACRQPLRFTRNSAE